MKKRNLITTLAVLATLQNAGATPLVKWTVPTLPAFKETGFDAATVTAAADSARKARRPASTGRMLTETDLKPDFKDMRDRILRIKTARELHQILLEMDRDENYDRYSDDLKYFAAQAVLLMPFRSIVYRLRPILENSNKTVHSSSVTLVKSLASGLRIFLPTDQWEAAFQYVTAPSEEDATNTQFKRISEFQKALIDQVTPQFVRAARRIQALHSKTDRQPIIWDNKLLYGSGTFEDNLDRFVAHGQAELSATLSFLHMSLHTSYVFGAYFQDDLPEVAHALGRLVGVDGFRREFLFGSDANLGVTAEDRVEVLRKREFKNFLVLYPEAGVPMMERALQHLHASIFYMDAGWRSLAEGEQNQFAILNPANFTSDRRVAEARLKSMKDMLAGRTAIRSVVTGDVVEIDLPSFFKKPVTDLKTLLPTAFDNGPAKLKIRGNSGREYEYRNYFRGRATGWDQQAWQTMLPNHDDAGKAIRVLSQSWGGDYLSPILASVIL
ncbi:MAG: hypothetical protein RJB38_2294 [Pseudomonadota bacterium]|jgi:hypothetical protein